MTEYNLESFYLYFRSWNEKLTILFSDGKIKNFKDASRIPEGVIFSADGRDFIRYGNTITER